MLTHLPASLRMGQAGPSKLNHLKIHYLPLKAVSWQFLLTVPLRLAKQTDFFFCLISLQIFEYIYHLLQAHWIFSRLKFLQLFLVSRLWNSCHPVHCAVSPFLFKVYFHTSMYSVIIVKKFRKGREETLPVRPLPRIPLDSIHLGWACATRKDSELEWLAKDYPETYPITIKPKTASQAAEQFSWVPLPSCPPPGCPFPIKSLALSAHVSPRTIHFWVLDKSPAPGPGRGPPSYNSLASPCPFRRGQTLPSWAHCCHAGFWVTAFRYSGFSSIPRKTRLKLFFCF